LAAAGAGVGGMISSPSRRAIAAGLGHNLLMALPGALRQQQQQQQQQLARSGGRAVLRNGPASRAEELIRGQRRYVGSPAIYATAAAGTATATAAAAVAAAASASAVEAV
jgi:hypothetical protein